MKICEVCNLEFEQKKPGTKLCSRCGRRAAVDRWNKRNPEKRKASVIRWQKANPDKVKAIRGREMKKNALRYQEYSKKYQKENKAYLSFCTAKKRAAKFMRIPKYANFKKILIFYWMAAELGRILGIKYEVDHIAPFHGKNVSGLHHEDNLQILRRSENRKKRNSFDCLIQTVNL